MFSLGLDAGVDDRLVMGFDRPVEDGPGEDLVVFENPFEYAADAVFMDLVVVAVSDDGDRWWTFPHAYVHADPTLYVDDPDAWQGFAGRTPVLLHWEDNRVDPFDRVLAGGDGFDLADLPPDTDGALPDGVRFVRLTSAGTTVDPSTGQPYPVDPIANGPDIDGVLAR